ncbi:AAA family ATPase [Rhizobium leguminosarum]|uniref:AAA family ATPase n=1 Tax=Rhizobium leguminosarum TaxID=384 RepID=UPI0039656B1D
MKNGYKRFHDLTIDLGQSPARIVALVGPNGSGKSSVFDGMLFHQQAHQRIGSYSADAGETYHFMDKVGGYHDIQIDFVDGPFNQMRARREGLGKPNTVFFLSKSLQIQ